MYPSIAHLWACVDGLIHSLVYFSRSCGSWILLFTAMLRFSWLQISITVNVKSNCQLKIQPINCKEQQTLAEVSAKAAVRCGLALGSIITSWWCPYMGGKSNVDSTEEEKNRAYKFLCRSHIFHIHMNVKRPLFLHDCVFSFVLFTFTVQKLQALSQ